MAQVQTISRMDTRVRVLVMAGTLLGLFTAAMDQTIVGTALPRVVADLRGLEHISWVFTAFMVTSTTTIAMIGKLTDIYGRKPFYLLGILILVVGSALAGASQSMIQLIAFRAIQGFGAGMIMGTAFAIIGDVFAPAERARWTGLMAGVFAAASVVGPLIGGSITDHLTWRWVFYVNLPIGALAFLVFFVVMPPLRPHGVGQRVDGLGVAVLVMWVVPLLLAFAWAGSEYAWASTQIIGLFLLATAAILVFIGVESRANDPIIPLSLFRSSIFVVVIAVTFLTAMGLFGAVAYIPLFVQAVIGTSATNSGLVTMPMMLAMSITAAVAGQLLARWGRYRVLMVVGLAVMTAGMYMLSQMDVGSSRAIATRDMVVLGIGLGASMPILFLAVQNSVSYSMLGVATSTIQFARSVGGTLGVAIMGSLLNGRLASELATQTPPEVAQNTPPPLLERIQDPQILVAPRALADIHEGFLALGAQGEQLFDQALLATRTALSLGITHAFLVASGVTLVALVVGIFLKEVPLREAYELPEMEVGGPQLEPRPALAIAFAPADPPPAVGAGGRPWLGRLVAVLGLAVLAGVALSLLRGRNGRQRSPP